jgi:hypothetical protein
MIYVHRKVGQHPPVAIFAHDFFQSGTFAGSITHRIGAEAARGTNHAAEFKTRYGVTLLVSPRIIAVERLRPLFNAMQTMDS